MLTTTEFWFLMALAVCVIALVVTTPALDG